MVFGLLILISGAFGSEVGFGGACIFLAMVTYVTLKVFVRHQKHYRSGLDDALILFSVGLTVPAFYLFFPDVNNLTQTLVMFLLCSYVALRFAHAVMSAAAFISFLAFVFYSIIPFGEMARIAVPFAITAVAFAVYLAVSKNRFKDVVRHYRSCLVVLEVLALATMYVSMNYFVVREVSNELFLLQLKEGQTIPGGSFFWITTVLIPGVYVARALQTKDTLMLRMGLITAAATIFTVRYYYSVMPAEIVMVIGGLGIIIFAWALTRYLKTPKRGITIQVQDEKHLAAMLDVEALVVAETYHEVPARPQDPHFKFGGGSSGGAGASGHH